MNTSTPASESRLSDCRLAFGGEWGIAQGVSGKSNGSRRAGTVEREYYFAVLCYVHIASKRYGPLDYCGFHVNAT